MDFCHTGANADNEESYLDFSWVWYYSPFLVMKSEIKDVYSFLWIISNWDNSRAP